MKTLIYDRTELDVIEAKQNPSSIEFEKGNYNYIDLNRLEEWCNYLKSKFKNKGIIIQLNLKVKYYNYNELKSNFKYQNLLKIKYIEIERGNWYMTDFPTLEEMNRIRDNIQMLKDQLTTKSILTIVKNDIMNYIQANILEQILFELDEVFKLYEKSLRYCGTFYCGEE